MRQAVKWPLCSYQLSSGPRERGEPNPRGPRPLRGRVMPHSGSSDSTIILSSAQNRRFTPKIVKLHLCGRRSACQQDRAYGVGDHDL